MIPNSPIRNGNQQALHIEFVKGSQSPLHLVPLQSGTCDEGPVGVLYPETHVLDLWCSKGVRFFGDASFNTWFFIVFLSTCDGNPLSFRNLADITNAFNRPYCDIIKRTLWLQDGSFDVVADILQSIFCMFLVVLPFVVLTIIGGLISWAHSFIVPHSFMPKGVCITFPRSRQMPTCDRGFNLRSWSSLRRLLVAISICSCPEHFGSSLSSFSIHPFSVPHCLQHPLAIEGSSLVPQLYRIGEASNPGPDSLVLRTCNPTKVAFKEDVFAAIDFSVFGISETAATSKVQNILKNKFASMKIKSKWSAPVPPFSFSSSNMRGLAGGSAILSTLPVRDTCEAHPEDITNSTRYCETHVQFQPHRFLFCANLYGPTDGFRYGDPVQTVNRLFNYAAQRGLRFVGPAAIMGDFNRPLSQLEAWQTLQANGWVDSAVLSSSMHGNDLDMTSFDAARHSFILVNRELARSLEQCRTSHEHFFSGHPVLSASFSLKTLLSPQKLWRLPKSFDGFVHDEERAEIIANQRCVERRNAFEKAISQGDIDKLASCWTAVAEQTLVESCVTVDGHPQRVKGSHLGRAQLEPLQIKHQVVPHSRKARNGDYQPIMDQCSVELRRGSKQLHRLQSLERQVRSLNCRFSAKAFSQAVHLWETILKAHGFHKGFATWVMCSFHLILPSSLPTLPLISELKESFEAWHSNNEKSTWLHKTKIKAINIVLDLPKGGKLAFRETKTHSLPPVNQIHHVVKCAVKKTPWQKEGRKELFGGPFDILDTNLPVTFQGQSAMIVSNSSSRVVLETPVRLKDASGTAMFLSQEKIFVEPEAIHKTLQNAWNHFFQRDSFETIEQPDPAGFELVSRIPTNQLASLPEITGTLVRETINNTKIHSGRGSDGFSTLDLKKLPNCLLEMLAFVLTTIEAWGKWPSLWTMAKTICLPKVAGPCGPHDVRPVTVMSRLYRLWGKIRGQQVSSFLVRHIPPSVGGPCKHVAADMIALLTAHRVEQAQLSRESLAGVVIDIVKCYNTVPRGVLLSLLRTLGVPEDILRAFKAMMIQMKRFFEVAGGCSSLTSTTTGIIEGCGFAIPAMLSLGILAFHILEMDNPECECAFFADNWSLFAKSPQCLLDGFASLNKIVHALSMKISPEKSWLWGTSPAIRKALHGVLIDNVAIPVVLDAKDLGVQQIYANKSSSKVFKKRLTKAKSKLGIIKAAKVPRGCKKRLALGAGFACVSYGSTVRKISLADIHSLRVHIGKAVQRSGSGANCYLACNALDFNLDPELKFTFQRFQLWKRFLTIFPSEKPFVLSTMWDIGNTPNQRLKSKHGPLVAFVGAIRRLGGVIVDNNAMIDFGFGTFRWTQLSSKSLFTALHRAWIKFFSCHCIERKGFDIDNFDVCGNARAYSKLGFQERSFVDALVTGRNCTNDFLSKYIPGIDETCALRGGQDSRIHRLFECQALDCFRKHKPALKRASKWPLACKHFGLCPPVKHIIDRDKIFTNDVPFTLPTPDETHSFVFTDGTAFFGEVKELVIAASAYVECVENKCEVKSTCQQLVPGFEQSSFVAEMFAILLTLNSFFHVTIFCDCQILGDALQQVLDGETSDSGESWCFSEIWQYIIRHIRARPHKTISIRKVKAHCDFLATMTIQQKWLVWGNNRVDQLAKDTIQTLHRGLYLKLQKEFEVVTRNRQDILEVYNFWALASLKFIRREADRAKEKRQGNAFSPEVPALYFPVRFSCREHKFSDEQFLAFPWGPIFLWRLCWWFSQLGWPTQECNQGRDVSLVELYVDFMLATGSRTPRNILSKEECKRKGFAEYILDDLAGRADVASSTLAQQHEVWVRALSWLQKHVVGGFFPTSFIDKPKSLLAIGCSLWYRGVALRPRLVNGVDPSKILNSYFIGPSGTHRSLSRVLDLKLPCVELAYPQHLNVSHRDRLRFTYKAAKIFAEGEV